ncbi:MAG: SDR family oxidoreductase [Paracoccaceae bacterium]
MSKFTLITGASEGLGVEFARIAAREGHSLILTARSEDKLNALAADLRTDEIDVLVIPADLSQDGEAERLWSAATEGRQVDVLVNNAGLGYNGPFDAEDGWSRELNSINVNLVALTRLMKLAVPHMTSQDSARILNVASVAGVMPGPNMAVYHATKAYVLSLSQAVAEELRGTNVTVTTLCPGATATNFFDEADMHSVRLLKMAPPAKAADVAALGWAKAKSGKRIVIPGLLNGLLAFSTRLLPGSWVTRIAAIVMGKS